MINGIDTREAREKVEIKKALFKKIYGLIISDGDVAKLDPVEIAIILEGVLKQFKEKYL